MTKSVAVLALAALIASMSASAQPADGKPQSLPITTIRVGPHPVVAEVAATPDQRTIGLMYRFSLPPDHGMLFVFPEPQPLSFWMRNTFIPLSIAFIDAEGRILNIVDMAPRSDATHPSRGEALYALEMRKGWFADKGVGPGHARDGIAACTKR